MKKMVCAYHRSLLLLNDGLLTEIDQKVKINVLWKK